MTVRIEGTGFQPGASVTLDGAATNVLVSGSTVIWATVPAHAEGTVDLVVTNPDGRSARFARAYSFARISVTSVQPTSGTIGQWVRIFGAGFLFHVLPGQADGDPDCCEFFGELTVRWNSRRQLSPVSTNSGIWWTMTTTRLLEADR